MSDLNRDKYIGFSIGILLTTDSGLRADLKRLDPQLRTTDNLKKLIRHNLYYTVSGVALGGQLAVKAPPVPPDNDIEYAVSQLELQWILAQWDTLAAASDAVNWAIHRLLDYDTGGSCPGYAEQPALFAAMRDAGVAVPDFPSTPQTFRTAAGSAPRKAVKKATKK